MICPACGRFMPPDVVLPPIKQRIYNAVRARPGITAERLRDVVWGHDPGGGPETRQCLHVHILQLNRRLLAYGFAIRGHTTTGYHIHAA